MADIYELPRDVRYLMDLLDAGGFRADVVGGCVRDMQMGIPPHDYDMTTSATPDEMKRVFAGERLIETGLKHGTLTVVVDHTPYEITTYREDGDYPDNRHPSSVTFTRSLAEDLKRRDFTMNALCYHPHYGLTDLFGGAGDIRARVVRAVGDPARRFSEDALRILRALRFSSVLDFSIAPETAAAIHAEKARLKNISPERIFCEWMKLLGGVRAGSVLTEYADVIVVFLPMLAPVLAHPLPALTGMDAPRAMMFLFSYLPPDGRCAAFDAACDALRTDNALRARGKAALSHLDFADAGDDRSLLYLLRDVGIDGAKDVLSLREKRGESTAADLARLSALLEKSPPYRIGDLAVRGEDLMALGARGGAVGEGLQFLLTAVLDGIVPNEKASLLAYYQKEKEKYGI